MKHLTTLLALLLSCSMLAQGPVEFPWNPDADGDDFIGVNDLMALLGEFDSVFSEEALYLSEDELSAMYDAGSMNYVQCQIACKNLPGNWKMPRLSEVTVSGEEMWLETPESGYYFSSNTWKVNYLNADGAIKIETSGYDNFSCFCATKERPKVEYTYCIGDWENGIQECAGQKVEDGWYPLGGISGHSGIGSDDSDHQFIQQAFWRWAE